MLLPRLSILALIAFLAGLLSAQKLKITFAEPKQFRAVPPTVRKQLTEMGCRIPQSYSEKKALNNLIPGEFERKGQRDWAALCAFKGYMRLVVIWGGASKCSARPWKKEEIKNVWHHVQDEGRFDTYVRKAPAERVKNLERADGKPLNFSVEHDGLEFGGEGGSVVIYCHEGKWHEFMAGH
jgi:hypothetical protein